VIKNFEDKRAKSKLKYVWKENASQKIVEGIDKRQAMEDPTWPGSSLYNAKQEH